MKKLLLVLVLVLLTGCGPSPTEAAAQLQALYKHDPNAYCTVLRAPDEPAACEDAIVFAVGQGPSTISSDGNELRVSCGRTTFGAVVSITTNGPSAVVELEREVKLDARAKKLSACAVRLPKNRATEEFEKSDGKWLLKGGTKRLTK
jgi:hypothetical protein